MLETLLKNMDDVLMGAPTLEALEVMITEFLLSCQAKNIKLKPSKFFISTFVEFGRQTQGQGLHLHKTQGGESQSLF